MHHPIIIHIRKADKTVVQKHALKDGEMLTYIYINFLPSLQTAETDLSFTLQKNSKLIVWNLIFGSGKEKLRQNIHFAGENAQSENYTLYFGEGTQNFQMFVTHLHEASSCVSRMYARGILKDQAFARYDGMIKILQAAKETDAFLEEKVLLLSPDAKSEAIPGLEIGTNDVKAAHSASCTRVDEAQLFYASSRGISEEEALKMIAEGFLKKLVDQIPDKKIHGETLRIIQRKLIQPSL